METITFQEDYRQKILRVPDNELEDVNHIPRCSVQLVEQPRPGGKI